MSRTPIFRRTAPVVAIAAVAALALTGCGRGGDDTSSSAAAPAVSEGPATGTIEVWVPGADGEALPNILGDFETANPDVTVNVTQIPEGEFDAKVLTAISTGTTPDMVSLPSQSQSTLLATEGFAAVPDGLVDPASFFSSIYEPGVIEGVSYTVPWYAYANTLQYRKDLAEKAGVTPPTTWDEVQPFADALQDAGADFGWALDVGYDAYTAQGLNEYVLQNGGSFVSEDGASWTINDPKNVEALEFWAKLIEDGNASPDGPGFLDVVPFFTEGTIGSRVNGPWFQGWLNDANGEDWTETHLGTATLPAGPDGTSVSSLGGGSFAVFDDAANADGAWKLAQYLAEPETQIAWYDEFGSLPAVESAWDEPVIADNELLDATRTAMATAVPVPQLSTWTEVASILGQQIERVSRGQATAQEALDEAQAQAESIGTGVE